MKLFLNFRSRWARVLAFGVCLAALAIPAAGGQADRSILQRAAAGVGLPPAGHDFTQIAPGADFVPNQLLVRFAAGVGSEQRAQTLNTLGGAQVAREYELVPGLCLLTLPAGQTVQQALSAYNGTSGILYAEPNYLANYCATFPNDPRFNELWGMNNTGQTGGTPGADIHAPEAWDFTTGTRQIVVGVLDSGVDYTHPDLTNNMWMNVGEIPGNGLDDDGNGFVDDIYGYDFANDDGDPQDDVEHGTHCAGTIGAEGNNSIGIAGVNWQVRLMAVKIGGLYGITTADQIAGIQYATLMGARVMNASWGGYGYAQALKDAIDGVASVNIVFVAAAGNDSIDNDSFPAYPASFDSPNIIAVMATDHNDARSDFSNYGLTSVDLGAPGTDILSCKPGGDYQLMSGTSMAAPHITGCSALLLAANPAATYADIKQALLSSVDPVLPGLCVSGGRVNLPLAITRILTAIPLVVSTNYISGGNGNSIVEFNECNNLNVILGNVGTTNVTGISVTLVTTNAEVAIARATSAYPDIAAGEFATNVVPFRISTSPDFVCGTPIQFSVIIKTDRGIGLQQFSLPTGLPGVPLRFDNNSYIPIPSPGTVSSSILVSNVNFAVNKITVSMFVEESFDYFLTLELIAPDGTTNLLSANNGLLGANYGLACSPESQRTTFDDDAPISIAAGSAPFTGSFKPTKPLSVFSGLSGTNINGLWQLRATDDGMGDIAAIHCWSLFVTPTLCVDGGGQCPGADLAVGITAQPNPVIVGNNLTYTIGVTNNGPSSATNITVTFLMPLGSLFVSAAPSQGTYAQSGNIVTFSLGRLGPKAAGSLSVVVIPTLAGSAAAVAIATSEQPDFIPGNNSVAFVMQVSPSTADLAVTMSAAPSPTLVGSALTYTVTVTNNGPSSASNITVTNTMPPSVSILSATGAAGSFETVGQVVFWKLSGFVSGAGASASITVIPNAEGTITATAAADGDQFDPVVANSSATVNTVVGPAADVAVGLTESPNPAVAGSNVVYQVTVTNFGPNLATGVIVNNLLPASFSVVSTSPGQGSTSISNTAVIWNVGTLVNSARATLSITATTSVNGDFNTIATAIAAQGDPNPTNNSVAVATTVAPPFIRVAAAGATLTYESGPTNGAIDLGETVTVLLRLRNEGNVSTRSLVASLLATNGVAPVPPNNPQTYGILFPSGFPVGRPFTFTATGTSGGTVSPTLLLQDGTSNYPPVSFTFTLPATPTFANSNAIIIPDPAAPNPPYPAESGPASPYPTTLTVSNLTGILGKVTVTLSNLTHSFPADISALLVAPGGAKTLLLSRAGDLPVTGLDLTFDDFAASPLPASGQLTSGTYQPAAYGSAPTFPTNAPPGPYPALLSTLNGVNPNGTWSLYVLDDPAVGGDAGAIAGGWSLVLTMITPVNQVADLALSGSAVPSPVLAGQTLTYTFTVTNNGPNTASSLSFTNLFPAGVMLLSASSSQGNVITNSTSVVASLGSLAMGTNATVTVRVNAAVGAIPGGLTNITLTSTASVAASENDVNLANNSVSVLTTLNRPVANLGLSQTVAPDPAVVGFTVTNTVAITNRGPGIALDTVLTQPLPPGAGFVPASSSTTLGALANLAGVVTCAFGDLDPGAAAIVTIVMTNSAPGLMTSAVSLGTASYDPATNDNHATYVATVVNPAAQIIDAGVFLLYESGPINGAVDPGETVTLSFALANVGSLDTANLKATLSASGGVTLPSPAGPQSYGVLLYGGPSAARSYTFQAATTAGPAVIATLQLQDERPGVTNKLGTVAYTLATPATTTFANSAAIAIPDHGAANPYPSIISVADLTGRVTQATVTLSKLTHSFPRDINALLVSPSGSNVLLMSHTGGGLAVTNLNLTFDDAAAGSLPNATRLSSGTYRPTTCDPAVTFPGNPAPKPYGSALSAVNWGSANGFWRLYIYDDANGDPGTIAGGWSLTLTTAAELPSTEQPAILSGAFSAGQFQLTVTAEPGYEYIVQGSTDLVSWVALSTNTNATGTFTYTDTTTPAPGSRYYRTLRR